jgi:hypothetical protein
MNQDQPKYRCTKCGLPCETMTEETFQPSAHAAGFMRRKVRRSLCCHAPVEPLTSIPPAVPAHVPEQRTRLRRQG